VPTVPVTAPGGSLPTTGSHPVDLLVIAALLTLLGVGTILVDRRRSMRS
jgi:LPXTG-motif cell wall-anchored protein